MAENTNMAQSTKDIFPQTVQYANAYVPFQQTATLFTPDEALKKGTVFAELHQPYAETRGGTHASSSNNSASSNAESSSRRRGRS